MIPLILRDFPDAFETERLIIRSPLAGDGPEVNAAIRESLESLRPWMPWAVNAPTIDETEANIREARCRFLERTDLRLHCYLKESGAFVVGSGLHRMDWRVPSRGGFQTRPYCCRTRYRGQGYVTEAVRGITRFAFETLEGEAGRDPLRCA